MINVRPMLVENIDGVALVHSEAFKRQFASRKWITCNFYAYPRILIYVATDAMNKITGFIQWIQKSGFRKEAVIAVIELEQIAVSPAFQGKKIGTELINHSLKLVDEYVRSQDSVIKSIMVTTRADNFAQELYRKTLCAEIVSTIKNFYSADEVI